MRIIAGTHRGHRIAAPKGRDTRPTSDRVRENAFNLIGPVDDADVLDLFAGSGAMGLEALSRGAAHATFVEHDRDACRVIDTNLDKLGLKATVLQSDAVRALQQERRTLRPRPLRPAVRLRRGAARAAPGEGADGDGVLVWETSSREPAPEVQGLRQRTTRTYGSARLTLFEIP